MKIVVTNKEMKRDIRFFLKGFSFYFIIYMLFEVVSVYYFIKNTYWAINTTYVISTFSAFFKFMAIICIIMIGICYLKFIILNKDRLVKKKKELEN